MIPSKPPGPRLLGRRPWTCLCLLAALLAAPPARAQGPATDPVETLRLVLNGYVEDPAERDRATKACLGELHTVSELRKAVVLREWRDRHPNAALAAVDRANRDALARRFVQVTQNVLRRNEESSVLAVLEALAEVARQARAGGEPLERLTRPFTADVVRLVGEGDERVRAAAAATLGRIDPDVRLALPVLATLAQSSDPAARLGAADALGSILQAAAQPYLTNEAPAARAPRREVVEVALGVLPALKGALADEQPAVRRRGVAGVATAAALLGKLLSEPLRPAELDGAHLAATLRDVEAERVELRPLAEALGGAAAAAARRVRGSDVEGKLLALRALEETAQTRLRWTRQLARTTSRPEQTDDPLADGLAAALPGLAEALADAEVRVRRAALDVLEALGPLAAAAAPAAARSLRDDDRFVRWSAVRTLGAIGPAARPAVPLIARLLDDPDHDVRLAAAAVLRQLDPDGRGAPKRSGPDGAPLRSPPRTALPALIRALRAEDVETRLATIRTLAGMGANARPAVPALAEAVRDPEARVRLAAVQALGALGPAAKSAGDVIREALKDNDAEVRRAAGDVLLGLEREP